MSGNGGAFPAPRSGWEDVDEEKYGVIRDYKHGPDEPSFASRGWPFANNMSATAGDDTIDWILVSPPLEVGTEFTTSDTVTMYQTFSEGNLSDNVDSCITSVYILDDDGSTINANLISVGSWGTVAEFELQAADQGLGGGTVRCLNAKTLAEDYTSVDGDRIVLEVGFSASAGGTTPQARMRTEGANANECDMEGAGAQPCHGNIIFSNDIVFEASPPVRHPDRDYNYGTRFYSVTNQVIGGPDISPSPDSGWETTSGFERYRMETDDRGWPASPFRRTQVDLTSGLTNDGLIIQMISPPLAAGTVFDDATTRVWLAAGFGEVADADNVTEIVAGIRVIDEDGSTVNATLMTVQSRLYPNDNVACTALDNCEGQAFDSAGLRIGSDYTTVEGDRLVVEMGASASGTTPQVSMLVGDSATTIGDNDLTSSDEMNTCPFLSWHHGNCGAVIEFNIDIPILGDPVPGPTRMYFPFSTAAQVSPSATAGFDETDEVLYRYLNHVKGTSTVDDGQTVDHSGTGSNDEVDRIYVSSPMPAGQVFSEFMTTIQGVLPVRQVANNDNIKGAVIAVYIYSEDGTTLRETLLTQAAHGLQYNLGRFEVGIGTTDEARNEYLSRPYERVENGYTTVFGDRIVVAIGFRVESIGGTTPQFVGRYGEDLDDCALNRIDTNIGVATDDCSGWLEFSNHIEFLPIAMRRPPWITRLLMADPIGVVRSLRTRWLSIVELFD